MSESHTPVIPSKLLYGRVWGSAFVGYTTDSDSCIEMKTTDLKEELKNSLPELLHIFDILNQDSERY